MRRFSIALSALLSAWPWTLNAASADDRARQVERMNSNLSALRQLIANKGSNTARVVDSNTKFNVIDSVFPAAMSRPSTGGRPPEIAMTTQMSLLLVYIAEINLVYGQDPTLYDCIFSYTTMASNVYSENLARNARSQRPMDTPAPEVFGRINSVKCGDLPRHFPLTQNLRPIRERQVQLALYFIYLHELAHIALEHTQQLSDEALGSGESETERMRTFLDAAKRSRSQEREADAWAIRELLRMGANPLEALPMTLIGMLIATGGMDCYLRLGLSHPDTTARMKSMIEVIISESNMNSRPLDPQVLGLFKDAIAISEKTSRLLECPKEE